MIDFPNPRTHKFPRWARHGEFYYDASDIIHFGGEMTIENLMNAYRSGIFPWTIDGLPLPWFCPERRAILEFDKMHLPKSLQKEQRKQLFTFTIDRAFVDVINICAEIKRGDEAGTWITADFIESYIRLHEAGAAHSVEAWDARGELVGGLYGVDAGGAFGGESMFHFAPNASKLALLFLVKHLKSRGAAWLDIQTLTPHLAALGATEISRADFLDKLAETLAQRLELF